MNKTLINPTAEAIQFRQFVQATLGAAPDDIIADAWIAETFGVRRRSGVR